jgi:hypothetical protein
LECHASPPPPPLSPPSHPPPFPRPPSLPPSLPDRGFLQSFLNAAKSLPVISWLVRRELDRQLAKLRKLKKPTGADTVRTLPDRGLSPTSLHSILDKKAGGDHKVPDSRSGVSGTVYTNSDHLDFLSDVYKK